MKRLTFFLSGEHPTIPSSEVMGAIEAENQNFEEDETYDQVLSLNTSVKASRLSKRLGMCHWIGEHFCSAPINNPFDYIGSSDLVDFLPQSKTIAIRVKRVKEYLPEVSTQELAKEIADLLIEKYDYEIDLEYPKNEVVGLLTDGKCILSILKEKVDRKSFTERRPPERTAVHPSTMQPNLARALVNLARTPRDGSFLDPFCGVGGILLEAGLLGADLIGRDINVDLIKGAEKNLQEENIPNFDLREGDARKLEIGKVDAIATDPPYGRQASTGGNEIEELYEESLPELARVLKSGKFLCITAPKKIDLEKIAGNLPLVMKEKHEQRVHKSLTRNIYVFLKRRKV